MNLHESPSQPNTDLKKKRRRRRIYLAVAVILWIVLWSAIFYALSPYTGESFIYGEKQGNYWLEVHPVVVPLVTVILPTLAIFVSLLIPGFITARIPSPLLFILILAVPVIPVLTLLGPTIDEPRHVQTLRYDDQIYVLAKRSTLESRRRPTEACFHSGATPDCVKREFKYEYLIFQCGQRSVMCHQIGNEAHYASQERLFVNSKGNVVLAVDGRMVWSYPDGIPENNSPPRPQDSIPPR